MHAPVNCHSRSSVSMKAYMSAGESPFLLPSEKIIRKPVSARDTRQCILNALSCTVPREGRIRLFGEWVDIVYAGFLFKGGELIAVIRTHDSGNKKLGKGKYHIASHLLQNCLHIGNKHLFKGKSRSRECVWKSLMIFSDLGDYVLNRGWMMTHVPSFLRSVAPNSHESFTACMAFIGEFFNGGGFLWALVHRSPLPLNHNALCNVNTEVCNVFIGRKNYKALECPSKCPCKWDVFRLGDIDKPSPSDIASIVPSIVDDSLRQVFHSLENYYCLQPNAMFLNNI